MVDKIERSQPFIKNRGGEFCRGCLGNNLFSGLDLGELPIANELLLTTEVEIEKFPLHLRICTDCGLGQVADVVTPERIFRDYRYLSSMSSTFMEHASDFVSNMIQNNTFSQNDWVLEIASNDGYLLRNFLQHKIKVVGVEPAENVAQISRSLGIETITDFFSSELAAKLLEKNGYPKLIIANNVMAHVPDLKDFIEGLAILCGKDSKISIENPSLSNILMEMQFDTIYHEHYSYLSSTSVAKLSTLHGLYLFEVEQLKTHGGSNRYWLRKSAPDSNVQSTIDKLIELEIRSGLFEENKWKEFSLNVSRVLKDFMEWLQIEEKAERRIFGYGAAAKASTLLNSIGVDSLQIKAIADLSPEKQGRFMPCHAIPILSPQDMFIEMPTDVIIFPWNIKSEVAAFLRTNMGDQVRLWCAIPEMHQVDNLC
jgi:hypothetical protein